jgi:hypothetical protein
MPKYTLKNAAERAQTQFAREFWDAATGALEALNAAKGAKATKAAVESAAESLAFLVEQAKAVLDSIPDTEADPYAGHVEALHEDLPWIHPVDRPVVYRDEESRGAFVEALIWVDDEEISDEDEDDLDEDEDDDFEDDLDEDDDFEDEE